MANLISTLEARSLEMQREIDRLTNEKRMIDRQIAEAMSLACIDSLKITRDQVFEGSKTYRSTIWDASALAANRSSPTVVYMEWDGQLHSISNLRLGKFDPLPALWRHVPEKG